MPLQAPRLVRPFGVEEEPLIKVRQAACGELAPLPVGLVVKVVVVVRVREVPVPAQPLVELAQLVADGPDAGLGRLHLLADLGLLALEALELAREPRELEGPGVGRRRVREPPREARDVLAVRLPDVLEAPGPLAQALDPGGGLLGPLPHRPGALLQRLGPALELPQLLLPAGPQARLPLGGQRPQALHLPGGLGGLRGQRIPDALEVGVQLPGLLRGVLPDLLAGAPGHRGLGLRRLRGLLLAQRLQRLLQNLDLVVPLADELVDLHAPAREVLQLELELLHGGPHRVQPVGKAPRDVVLDVPPLCWICAGAHEDPRNRLKRDALRQDQVQHLNPRATTNDVEPHGEIMDLLLHCSLATLGGQGEVLNRPRVEVVLRDEEVHWPYLPGAMQLLEVHFLSRQCSQDVFDAAAETPQVSEVSQAA
mmetsp:Transcript_124197/g.362481  ORF Transcript_124197/g.362481 Transcript_124197/m.362481 type:complete len:424 (-) Transcript_124197:263-1534(-)